MSRYKVFSDNQSKVIVVSSYAGRNVRGVAKCDPNDTFDYNKGVEIAKARCDLKIARKRQVRAIRKFEEAKEVVAAAVKKLNDMRDYYDNAKDALYEAENKVRNLF